MFRLKTIFAISMASAMALFNSLFMHNRVPFPAVNLIFLMASPAGYIYSGRTLSILAVLSWIVFYPAFILVYNIDPINAAVPIVVFNGLALVCFAYKKIVRREELLCGRSLKEEEASLARLRKDFVEAEMIEEKVKSSEAAIISLYEITKRMSESLKFNDIFDTFSIFLKDNFLFRRCNLLMLRQEDDAISLDREYSVWKAPKGAGQNGSIDSGDKPDFRTLVRIFSGGSREICISRTENPQTFDDLGITNTEVETFVAMPLMSEKRMVGILDIENLPKADIERFVILAMQFALEMKKVLLYEMVERMAITDSLTGLYVRRHFYERLNEELTRSKRYNFKFAFLMLDIDDFKRCNDTYGHLVGDVILKEMVRVIRENVREIDIVGRYGGEEISLVLPETGKENARIVAERLRTKIAEHIFKAYDEKLKITVSVGISAYPRDGIDAKTLVDRADEALYAAKKSGKNVVCVYKR